MGQDEGLACRATHRVAANADVNTSDTSGMYSAAPVFPTALYMSARPKTSERGVVCVRPMRRDQSGGCDWCDWCLQSGSHDSPQDVASLALGSMG